MNDQVLTVAIGDMDSDGNKLSPRQWDDFQDDMRWVLIQYGEVVAQATGTGVGTDGANEGVTEATCVFIVINPTDDGDGHLGFMRSHVANVARAYGQTSVCFAFDHSHEPVFTSTKNGARPSATNAPVWESSYPLTCTECGRIGNEEDGIELGGECVMDDCEGTIVLNEATPGVINGVTVRNVNDYTPGGVLITPSPFTVVGSLTFDALLDTFEDDLAQAIAEGQEAVM